MGILERNSLSPDTLPMPSAQATLFSRSFPSTHLMLGLPAALYRPPPSLVVVSKPADVQVAYIVRRSDGVPHICAG
jgi:hypothetical protein